MHIPYCGISNFDVESSCSCVPAPQKFSLQKCINYQYISKDPLLWNVTIKVVWVGRAWYLFHMRIVKGRKGVERP